MGLSFVQGPRASRFWWLKPKAPKLNPSMGKFPSFSAGPEARGESYALGLQVERGAKVSQG